MKGDFGDPCRCSAVLDKHPHATPDAAVHEFIRLVLSREGQELVEKAGFLRLPPAIVEQQLAKLVAR